MKTGIPDSVLEHLLKLRGMPCEDVSLGRNSLLRMSFGAITEKKLRKESPGISYEWEIGSFYNNWRLVKNGNIVAGAQDTDQGGSYVKDHLLAREFGALREVVQTSAYGDISVFFSGGQEIQFMALISEDDEIFHVFCPGFTFVEFNPRKGWTLGVSNKPWPNES